MVSQYCNLYTLGIVAVMSELSGMQAEAKEADIIGHIYFPEQDGMGRFRKLSHYYFTGWDKY